MTRYASILKTIGRTPLVRLARLAPPDVNVHVKVEAFNPMGSVKDRMALAVIEAAERSGTLRPGQTVNETTSGNTGIGLAMVRLRPVLAQRTGAPTIPQIFVGGEPFGGCGELFEAWADGSLGERLAACGVAFDSEARIDPELLLPAWLHPRSTTA